MLFSVIIPLYNKERQISDAIKSVLSQTDDDYEVLIIDDGSTDGSYSVAVTFSDPRIRIIRQQNSGVAVARNKGIQVSTGDYVCFLDADDLWLPNHLTALKGLIETYPDAGLYATRYRLVESDGTEKTVPLEADRLIDDLFELELTTGYSYLITNSVCIPKQVFDKVGCFVPGERLGEDSSLWLRIAAYYDIALSKSITTTYRREYSDAFTGLALPENWSFLKYSKERLLLDNSIPPKKREYIAKYNNRYLLSLCRHTILLGDKAKARKLYTQVNFTWSGKREKLITDICFLIPAAILRKAYHSKYHGSFSEDRKIDRK